MTGSVIVIFLAIVFVFAIVGPQYSAPQTETRRVPENKNYEEGEGPPNVVNHRPKRKPKLPPEEDRTLTTDTFAQLMSATKEKKNNVRFE